MKASVMTMILMRLMVAPVEPDGARASCGEAALYVRLKLAVNARVRAASDVSFCDALDERGARFVPIFYADGERIGVAAHLLTVGIDVWLNYSHFSSEKVSN